MPKPFYIVVSPVASKFARALQSALANKVINKVYRRLTPKPGRSFFAVTQRPLNKVEQFERFTAHEVSCPAYATTVQAAKELGCRTLFARTLINSTNGRGIVEFSAEDGEYPRAPLYTEYIPKKAEYRFHVFGGQVIDIQQKKKKVGWENDENNERKRDTRVRNCHNGYVYCRDGVVAPDGAAALAVRAVEALGYQYGAVDVIWNEKRGQSYVLEVNSRPGIINQTCDSYANAIIAYYQLTRK